VILAVARHTDAGSVIAALEGGQGLAFTGWQLILVPRVRASPDSCWLRDKPG